MHQDEFVLRHIGPRELETNKMLASIEVESLEELLKQTIPEEIRLKSPLSLPKGISENKFLSELQLLSDENKLFETYIGLGYNPTYTSSNSKKYFRKPWMVYSLHSLPSRNFSGRLEALFNFQTMVCDLTGMELSNASLLDEGRQLQKQCQ